MANETENILLEASSIIYGARAASYGHALDNFKDAADILRVLVRVRYHIDIPFTPDFIGLMMAVAIKGAREANKHSRDNIVDIAGYAGTIEQVFNEAMNRERSEEQ